MNKLLALIFIIMLVAVDQAAKFAASSYLQPVGSLSLIPGVLHLTYATNTGAAFGLFQGGRWFFVLLTLAVIGSIAYYFLKLPQSREYAWVRLTLILICGGALGNFVDRLLKGYVVDFLHVTFIRFPIFNFADIFLVTGTFCLSLLLLFVIKDEAPLTKPERAKTQSAAEHD